MKNYPKKTKKAYQPRFNSNGEANLLNSTYAPTTEKQKQQLSITSNAPASWMNADGSKNFDKYNDFLEEREQAKFNSKSI